MADITANRADAAPRRDLTDRDLFPLVSDKKLAWFAEHGTRRPIVAGELRLAHEVLAG